MIFTGVNCGDLTGRQYSEHLVRALSANQEFFYVDMFINDVVGPNYKHEGRLVHKKITDFLDENIIVDEENDILIIREENAILDAYDFSGLNDREIKFVSEGIIQKYKNVCPDYEYVLLPGKFPLGIDGKIIINGKERRKETAHTSSHILCVKDYKKHLIPAKQKIKK